MHGISSLLPGLPRFNSSVWMHNTMWKQERNAFTVLQFLLAVFHEQCEVYLCVSEELLRQYVLLLFHSPSECLGKRYLEEGKTNCIRTRTSTIYTYYSLLLRFYILWYACITQAFNSEGERRPGKLVMSGGCVWRLSKNSPKWFYVWCAQLCNDVECGGVCHWLLLMFFHQVSRYMHVTSFIGPSPA